MFNDSDSNTVRFVPPRQIRAVFDETTITVYQAYGHEIADAALKAGTFQPPFRTNRTTWIKPSFLWMMYRSGWGTKPGQERTLAITMTRRGFEQALASSCLSHFDPTVHSDRDHWRQEMAENRVRIQWDPERDLYSEALPYRSIQIGIGPEMVDHYVHDWIVEISDISVRVDSMRDPHTRSSGDLPHEAQYPVPQDIANRIGIVEGAP